MGGRYANIWSTFIWVNLGKDSVDGAYGSWTTLYLNVDAKFHLHPLQLSKKTCVACASELGPVGLYTGIIRKLLASLRSQWQQTCIALPSTRNDPSIIHMLSIIIMCLFCSNITKLIVLQSH